MLYRSPTHHRRGRRVRPHEAARSRSGFDLAPELLYRRGFCLNRFIIKTAAFPTPGLLTPRPPRRTALRHAVKLDLGVEMEAGPNGSGTEVAAEMEAGWPCR